LIDWLFSSSSQRVFSWDPGFVFFAIVQSIEMDTGYKRAGMTLTSFHDYNLLEACRHDVILFACVLI